MDTIAVFARELALETGELIQQERDQMDLSHSYKGGNELVTSADVKADTHICTAIAARYPDHVIVSEETYPDVSQIPGLGKPLWIIDPIDGTVNYAHGHNQSAVSIAYAEAGRVRVGVVYNPFTDELFSAELGQGARLNGKPIRVAGETNPRRAIIATGFPYEKVGIDAMVHRLHRILMHCADVRRLGSAALDICWLACGRLDGYYESLNLWDFAAARLVAEEAGAQCGHFSPVPAGRDPRFYETDLLIANPVLFPKLHAILQD